MFRDMRRKKQQLSQDETIAVLTDGPFGVLGLLGDEEYPYTVPVNYVYDDGKIFFHCAHAGYMADAIAGHDKASFCVIEKADIIREKATTYYRSVIAFGKARILNDAGEKGAALEILAAKYSPGYRQSCVQDMDAAVRRTCVVEITIEHMTGKEALDLVNAKHP